MSLLPVAGKGCQYPLVRGEHRIQDEEGVQHGASVHHCLVHRVAIEDTGRGVGIFARPLPRIEHGKMARHAAFAAGHPGEDTLAAAAESGKVVETDGAGEDHLVSLGNGPVDLHLDAVTRHPEQYQLARIVAVVINHPDPAVERAENLAVLRLCLLAVNSQGNDNGNVAVADASTAEALHQNGKVDLAAGIAGDIRSDDHHPLAGFDGCQLRSTAVEGRGYDLLRRTLRNGWLGTDDRTTTPFGEFNTEAAVAVVKFHNYP